MAAARPSPHSQPYAAECERRLPNGSRLWNCGRGRWRRAAKLGAPDLQIKVVNVPVVVPVAGAVRRWERSAHAALPGKKVGPINDVIQIVVAVKGSIGMKVRRQVAHPQRRCLLPV